MRIEPKENFSKRIRTSAGIIPEAVRGNTTPEVANQGQSVRNRAHPKRNSARTAERTGNCLAPPLYRCRADRAAPQAAPPVARTPPHCRSRSTVDTGAADRTFAQAPFQGMRRDAYRES